MSPARTGQIDMLEQTFITWLDGHICGRNERGRYPVKHDDRVTASLTCYNYNELVEKAYCATVSSYEKWVFENIPMSIGVITCVLFDIYGKGYFSDKPKGGGYRSQTYSIPGLGSFVQAHPVEDNENIRSFGGYEVEEGRNKEVKERGKRERENRGNRRA